jgi:glutathione S-transferase
MALTIYGSPRSRTMRVLWLASELALDFEHVPLAWDDPLLKSAEFLRINPAGAIPAIVDDGFALAESMAIALYLAKKYGAASQPPLYPPTLPGEAEAWRWSLWAQQHLEPWVQRDASLAEARAALGPHADVAVACALAVLDRALGERSWLLGSHFTVADLNVAGVLSPSRAEHLELGPVPRVRDWLARCYGRPAAIAARNRFAPVAPRESLA